MKENAGKSIVIVEFGPLMMEYALKLPIQCKHISILFKGCEYHNDKAS